MHTVGGYGFRVLRNVGHIHANDYPIRPDLSDDGSVAGSVEAAVVGGDDQCGFGSILIPRHEFVFPRLGIAFLSVESDHGHSLLVTVL